MKLLAARREIYAQQNEKLRAAAFAGTLLRMSDAINIKTTRDEKAWEVEISAEIPAAAMEKYRDTALKEIQKTAKLDGFRPGKAPVDRILSVYGETAVLREAAEQAIQHEVPEILAKENLPIVDTPRVTTSTPESGKPLTFTARAPLAPEIQLPDYKKIAEKHRELKDDTSVSDKEHQDALTHLRRERARIEKVEAGAEPQKAAEESKSMDEKDLPALDDEFVQSLGYPDTGAFSEALRKNIGQEKEARAREKRRAAIIEDLVKNAKISYPSMLKDYELDDMEARMQDDVARFGQTLDQYLESVKKTREQLRKDWEKSADERAKIRLILSRIAQKEGLEPGAVELEHELEHAVKHYPKASKGSLRAHVAHAMRNEMVLRFLEGDTEPVGHTASTHSEHADHDH